jgi:hypothetical protein
VHRPDCQRRGVDATSVPVSLPLDPPGRHVWLIMSDPLYPANHFFARAPWRILRRFYTFNVLVMELTDQPEPTASPPSAATPTPTTSLSK